MLEVFRDGLKLSSGSWLLNLACSGSPEYSMVTGNYYWMCGDSGSGKTFWTLQHLAEAAINPAFDKYDLIFDNVENGALMDIAEFFGPKLASRMQSPHKTKDGYKNSRTVEDFYFGLDTRLQAVKAGKANPFIYLTDSMDALLCQGMEDKFEENKEAYEDGDDVAGDYKVHKARWNSERLGATVTDLRATNSILMIISQTRTKLGATKFQKQKTVSGGWALGFYAAWQLWSSVVGEISKTVHGNKRQIGNFCKIAIEKNRLSGKQWDVVLPIYWSHGIDDIGACVDFLVQEKYIKSKDGVLTAVDLDYVGSRDGLIAKIHGEKMYRQLKAGVVETWREVERLCSVDIPAKYS